MFGLLRPWSPRASAPRVLAPHPVDFQKRRPKITQLRFLKVNGKMATNLPHGVTRKLFDKYVFEKSIEK